MGDFNLGDFDNDQKPQFHPQVRHPVSQGHYNQSGMIGNEQFTVRRTVPGVPAFTSPGEGHVVSGNNGMMRPQSHPHGGHGGHGGTYVHPNRMMMPPGSHPALVHQPVAMSQASGVMHHVTSSHPQMVHAPPPPHRVQQSRYYGAQNGGGVPMGPPSHGVPPSHLTSSGGGRVGVMAGPGGVGSVGGPVHRAESSHNSVQPGGGGGVHNMVIPNNVQYRNASVGNRSNTAPLATNIVGNVMTGVTPTRPMMTAHPITETLQYQSTTTTTPTNGTVRENQNHPNTSAKTPNGQRILSLPHSSNGSGEESNDDEEEYIETKHDKPKAARLDNSELIKELKIGKKRRKELLEYDDRQRMLRLVDAFSDEQVNRYEMYRRSCFPRNQIKRLMTQTANCSVHQQVCIAMAGVAKVFVGEIVEEALKVAEVKSHEGALLPSHIREAVRKLGEVDGSHLNDQSKKSKRLF